MSNTVERSAAGLLRLFVVALAVWIVTAALLGIPHGLGHSIEKMTVVQTIRDIAFPVWSGILAGLVGLGAARVIRARPADRDASFPRP